MSEETAAMAGGEPLSDAVRALGGVMRFFADHDSAGLVLPDGWFGRPYDNVLDLTTFDTDGGELMLEFDGLHRLTLAGPVVAESTERGVRLVDFTTATWTWRERAGAPEHRSEYTAGAVELVRPA